MKKGTWIEMARILLYIAGWYAVFCLGAYFFQRQMIFFPDKTPVGAPADHGVQNMQRVTMKTEDGLDLAAWFGPPREAGGKVIVLFHGNASNILNRVDKARYFMRHGYGFLLCEYRGYGGNPGKPSEHGLYSDGRACLAWLREEGYSLAQTVFYGESIGSGVAVQMALEMQPKLLVLEAPFSSMTELARARHFWLPVSLLLKHRFESREKIGKVRSSLLVFHGDGDMVVPSYFGERLFEQAAHPKERIVIKGAGHNDLYSFGAGKVVLEWLERQEEGQ